MGLTRGFEGAAFLHAVQFLTRLPVQVRYDPAAFAASPRWYPAVGAAIGGAVALVLWVGALIWPTPLAVVVALSCGMLLTGALHEDGLADTLDGLGGGATADRALEIMRDSRIGAYGAAGLGLVLAAKVLSLSALPLPVAAAALIAGHGLSRGAAVLLMARSVYLRRDGAGVGVSAGTGLWVASVCAGLAWLPLAVLAPGAACLGVVGLGLGYGVMARWILQRLNGHTGDCLGAVQQTSALGLYLGVAAWL